MTKTKKADAPSDAELDAIEAELTGERTPLTGEQLYAAFIERRRQFSAVKSFDQLDRDEQADWNAAAEAAK